MFEPFNLGYIHINLMLNPIPYIGLTFFLYNQLQYQE